MTRRAAVSGLAAGPCHVCDERRMGSVLQPVDGETGEGGQVMRRGSWGVWRIASALACVVAAGVFTSGAAGAAPGGNRGGSGGTAASPAHPPKGDEPGRGAG